jgi:peptide/nickel transport system substrate-binding protein
MHTRLLRGVAVCAALTLALAACSSGTPTGGGGGTSAAPTDGTLTVGLLGDIGSRPTPTSTTPTTAPRS